MTPLAETIADAVLKRIRAYQVAPDEFGADEGSKSRATSLEKVSVREARFTDFENVCALGKRLGQGTDSRENWLRLWESNPALEGGKRISRIGWVIENKDAIVGFLGNIPLVYEYQGRELAASATCRFAVDPAYRPMSHLLVTSFFRQRDVDLFLNTTATPSAGKIMTALKAKPLPQPDYDTVLFWVLRPRRFIRAVLAKMGVTATLAAPGSALASIALGTNIAIRRRSPELKSPTADSVAELGVDDLGDEFESFWLRERQKSSRLMAKRTRAIFRWHFCTPGSKQKVRVLACKSGGLLQGYAVVRHEEATKEGLRRTIIADLMAGDGNPKVVEQLISGAYQSARNAGSDILEVMGFPGQIKDIFLSKNPYTRKYPACPFFYKAHDRELQERFSDENVWYACPFDGDSTLWP